MELDLKCPCLNLRGFEFLSRHYLSFMSENKSNPIEYQNYVVTFLDVLGQRESFKPIERFRLIEHTEEFKKALESIHIGTAHYVKSLRNAFIDSFKQQNAERPIPNSIPQDKIEEFKKMRQSNLKYKTFSDSMLFFTSLNTDCFHCRAMNSVSTMFTVTGGLLLATLAEKKVYRAGIDVGIGIEIEDDEVYGPALFRAYDLESKIAQYPRIVVGDALINYLKNLKNENSQIPNQTMRDIRLCKTWAEDCLNSLKTDIDGYVILDYLGENFSGYLKEAFGDKFQTFLGSAFDFVESEYLRFKKTKDTKMSQRYYWLYQYFLDYRKRNS